MLALKQNPSIFYVNRRVEPSDAAHSAEFDSELSSTAVSSNHLWHMKPWKKFTQSGLNLTETFKTFFMVIDTIFIS